MSEKAIKKPPERLNNAELPPLEPTPQSLYCGKVNLAIDEPLVYRREDRTHFLEVKITNRSKPPFEMKTPLSPECKEELVSLLLSWLVEGRI